ncbi:MAG: RNA polymerase sigma factor [Phycisphaerae bacterium]
MTPEDQNLIKRIVARDREAFAAFYDRHAPRILGLLIRQLGKRAEAEDALQETFSQIWSRASHYDSQRGSVIAWMVRIAWTRGIDVHRKRQIAMAGGSADHVESQMSSDIVERNDLAEFTVLAMNRLPELERDLITLSFYRGMTHEEIARAQDLPLGTVKSCIRRGMQQLRESLSTNGDGGGH